MAMLKIHLLRLNFIHVCTENQRQDRRNPSRLHHAQGGGENDRRHRAICGAEQDRRGVRFESMLPAVEDVR